MKKQYDFSKAERGKPSRRDIRSKPSPRDVRSRFHKPNLQLNIPVYLDPKLQKSVEEIARRKGQEIGAVVSHIVRKEVELIEEMQ